jgi:hypothetical protein
LFLGQHATTLRYIFLVHHLHLYTFQLQPFVKRFGLYQHPRLSYRTPKAAMLDKRRAMYTPRFNLKYGYLFRSKSKK